MFVGGLSWQTTPGMCVKLILLLVVVATLQKVEFSLDLAFYLFIT